MPSPKNKKLERRVGLTRGNYNLGSLHPYAGKPPRKQQERETTADLDGGIYGPPVTESDEESLDQEEKQSAPISPLSEPKSSNASIRSPKANGLRARSSSHQSSSPPREIPNPVSNIRPTTFGNSMKRSNHMMSGDLGEDEFGEDFAFSCQKKKKPRKSYTRHSNMLDTTPKTEKINKGRTKADSGSPTAKKSGPKFRVYDTQSMFSQVDEMEEREAKNAAIKATLQSNISPRAQRASNRSRNLQKTSNDTFKSFKMPDPLPSPKSTSTSEGASQKFIMPIALPDDAPTPRAARSKKSFKMPDTIKTTSNMKSLLETAQMKFKLPDIYPPPPTSSIPSSLPSTSNDAASSSSISSPPSSPEIEASIQGLMFEKTNIPYFREPPTLAKCPICKKIVERDFLESFGGGARLKIRQQLRFCKAHQARTAESEWEAKGYPKIDWQQFDKRLACFHGDLDEILRGKRQSFYRNAFEDHLKSGQNRTLRQAMMSGSNMEGLIPGYYGSRGAKLMMENIMTHFAPKLRHLAASDKLLSSGGVSGYVQAVLAPELAVLLVMQDMSTDEEGARAVLRDSVEIGNLLNEEEDEVIKDPEPRDVVEL